MSATASCVREAIRDACPMAQPMLGPEQDLHRHLGFSADDVRRLVCTLQREFGCDLNGLNAEDHAPAARPSALSLPTCQIFGGARLRPLTVGDLERAVAAGRWREAG